MAAAALRSEERIGLVVAIAAHVGLAALLLWHPKSAPVVLPPERIEVTISDDVGLTSTSPQPQADAAPDIAPDIGEPPPPEPEAAPPPPKPEPPKPAARPEPQRPEPRPVPKPTMRPEPPKPVVKPTMRPAPRPNPAPARPAAKPNPAPARPSVAEAFRPTTTPGGTRVGADFLKGLQGARTNGPAPAPAAATIGPAVQSALSGAIARQLKPRWAAPQGADAEKLVTILSWSLNRDGTLAGSPRVVRQEGITEANRPQAARHAEQAIRAVELAAPFQLPAEYYDAWKRIASFRFDKRLSQ